MSRSLLTLRRSLAAAALALSLSTVATAPASAQAPTPTPTSVPVSDAQRPTVATDNLVLSGSPAAGRITFAPPTAPIDPTPVIYWRAIAANGDVVGGNSGTARQITISTNQVGPYTVVGEHESGASTPPSAPFDFARFGQSPGSATISDFAIAPAADPRSITLSWSANWTGGTSATRRFEIFDGSTSLGETSDTSFTLKSLRSPKYQLIVRSKIGSDAAAYYGTPSVRLNYVPVSGPISEADATPKVVGSSLPQAGRLNTAVITVIPPLQADDRYIQYLDVLDADGRVLGSRSLSRSDADNRQTVNFSTALPGPYTVVGRFEGGGETPPSAPFLVTNSGPDLGSALITGVTAVPGAEPGTLSVSWSADWRNLAEPYDPDRNRFVVYGNGQQLGTTSATSLDVIELGQSDYRITVRSVTTGEIYGTPSAPVDVTITPQVGLNPRAPQFTGYPEGIIQLASYPESVDLEWAAPSEIPSGKTIEKYEVVNAAGVVVSTPTGPLSARVSLNAGESGFRVVGRFAGGGSTPPSRALSIFHRGPTPNTLRVEGFTSVPGDTPGTVKLSWSVVRPEGTQAPLRVNIFDGVTLIGSTTETSLTLTGLTQPRYRLTYRAVPGDTTFLPAVAFTAIPTAPYVEADYRPTVNNLEGGVKVISGWPESFSTSWTAPKALPDGKTIERYEVQNADGDVVGVPNSPTVNAADLVSLRSGDGGFRVVGYYSGGGTTESAAFGVLRRGPQITFPVVQSVTATAGAQTGSVTLSWVSGIETPGDAVGWNFLVYDGVKLVGTVVGPASTITLTGIEPSSTHRYRIRPERLDAYGRPSSPIDYTAPAGPVGPVVTPFAFAVTGAVTLKTLVTGAVPLAGTLKGDVTGDALSADLTLAPGTAKLKAYGFLPVTASVQLVPTTKLAGTVTGTQLTASVKARVKLPSIKVFGIQLAGGQNCQAKSISTIPVTSPAGFSPSTGGTLAGTFPISDLSGCGALTGLVSPLTAGQANAIAINLAKAPSA